MSGVFYSEESDGCRDEGYDEITSKTNCWINGLEGV